MERCRTCKHWVPYLTEFPNLSFNETDVQNGGYCHNSAKLTEDHGQGHGADMLVYAYDESGRFWTGPEFGCVHHESA